MDNKNNNINKVITTYGTEAKMTTMAVESKEQEAQHCTDRIRETRMNDNLVGNRSIFAKLRRDWEDRDLGG